MVVVTAAVGGETNATVLWALTVIFVATVVNRYPSARSAAWLAWMLHVPTATKFNAPLVELTPQIEGVCEV